MTSFKASKVGAMDSDAIRSGRPVGAHLLRHMAGQANLQRDLPSTMSSVSMEASAERPYRLRFEPNSWRLVMPWYAPRRPLWTEATLGIIARVPSGTTARFGIRFRKGPIQEALVFEAGTVESQTALVSLPLGGELERCMLWVKGGGEMTSPLASLIGTPLSWQSSPTTTKVLPEGLVYSGAPTWDEDELSTRKYTLQAEDANGVFIQNKIAQVVIFNNGDGYIVLDRSTGRRSDRRLRSEQIERAKGTGTTFTIFKNEQTVDLMSVTLVGGLGA